jgi:hypothetical protein
VVSFTPLRLYPRGKSPGTHCIWGLVDPRATLDDVEKRKFLTLPGLELRPLGRPARSQSFPLFVSWFICMLLNDAIKVEWPSHTFLFNVLPSVIGCMWYFIVIICCIMTGNVIHLNQAFSLIFDSRQGARFSSSPWHPDLLWDPLQPTIRRVPGRTSLEVKRPERETGHSPVTSDEVKNSGAIPPLTHTSSWHSA